MKKIFSILSLVFSLSACDNGDIIVTSFDLEDSELELCALGTLNVFYTINNDGNFESMSLELTSDQLEDIERALAENTGENIEFDLVDPNELTYRIYDGEIPTDEYFCEAVPPSEPRVIDEYTTDEGTVVIRTNFNDITDGGDADGDGIPNIEEGMDPNERNNPTSSTHQDTDGDGRPDYLDIDDDGDNVPTSREIASSISEDVTDEGYPDTDEDRIPNYLDNDDDEDGVETRFEVNEDDPNTWANPASYAIADRPNYLNVEIAEDAAFLENTAQIDQTIARDYRTNIEIRNFNFVREGGDSEQIRFTTYNLGSYTFSLTPEEEEEEEEDPDTEEENEG